MENHYLAVDRDGYFNGLQGPLLVNRIEDRFQIDHYGVDPAEVLKPFFERIYDEVDLERP